MRTDYLTWTEYFFKHAFVASQRSKDPSTQNGAVIVNNDNIIIGIGYNGFIKGIEDNHERWINKTLKYKYVVHAEHNAIDNSIQDIKGCKLYLYSTKNFLPCEECAKKIAHRGIKSVHILGYPDKNDYFNWEDTKDIFKKTSVEIILEKEVDLDKILNK